MTVVNKVVRDGKVAVIVSPGYGAGWSSWNSPEDAFDPEVVAWIEGGKVGEPLAEEDLRYAGGLQTVVIQWLPIGTVFRIDEYDGLEHVKYYTPEDYLVA